MRTDETNCNNHNSHYVEDFPGIWTRKKTGLCSGNQNNDKTLMNDVWSSTDGKEWKLEVANAGWSKRAHGQAVVFKDKIWITGGAAGPKMLLNSEVWSLFIPRNWFGNE